MMKPKTRKFPKLNKEVTEIGLGCWQLGGDFGAIEDAVAEAILEKAIEQGIRFYDTADVYGGGRSEEILGRVLGRHGRERFVIASKVGRGGGLYPDRYTREGVKAGVEATLGRLGIECLDLIQLHCVPLSVLEEGEIFDWLGELVEEGKVRGYGASVETVEQGMAALRSTELASLQVIFNVFRQKPREELFAAAAAQNTAIIVRLPLNSGLLSGKIRKDTEFTAEDHRNYNRDGAAFHVGETFGGLPLGKGVDLVEDLRSYCPDGYSLADFAQRFILDFPEVTTVITGASRPEQVERNAAVSSLPPLSASIHESLYRYYKEQVVPHIRGGE